MYRKLLREKEGFLTTPWLVLSGLALGAILLIFIASVGQSHSKLTDKLMVKKLADDIAVKIDRVAWAANDSSVRMDLPKATDVSISGNTVTVKIDNVAGTATFLTSIASEGAWHFQNYIRISKSDSVVAVGGQ